MRFYVLIAGIFCVYATPPASYASPPPVAANFIPIFGPHTDVRGKSMASLGAQQGKFMPMAASMVKAPSGESRHPDPVGVQKAADAPSSSSEAAPDRLSTMTIEEAQQILSIFSGGY